MGKGGTKFVADAVGTRTARPKGNYTNKDLKKMMDKYIETGQHPEIERIHQQRQEHGPIYPLPDNDPYRQYVFLELNISKKNTEAIRVTNDQRLRHMELGAVSLSRDGQEIAISLGRSLTMDETHQVVGRVHFGKEILEQMNDMSIMPDDSPSQAIRIIRTGATNAKGTHEELGGAGSSKTAVERAEEDSSNARSGVLKALEVGMKRKADAAGPPERASKPKLLHDMLGELSSSESDSAADSAGGVE